MTLHNDLLEQADHLARREPQRPRQASLRRAVSAAYYALFHLLLTDATLTLIPNKPDLLRLQSRRAFAHRDMKETCKGFATRSVTDRNNAKNLLHLITPPLEPEIVHVAATFVSLQQARHNADYDLSQQFGRFDVLQKIQDARQAMIGWKRVYKTPHAKVFLTALLLQNRWRG